MKTSDLKSTTTRTQFAAFGHTRRKHYPAFRNDLALELRIVKNKLRNPNCAGRDRIIVAGVMVGLRLALKIWKRNTVATQQALWADAAGTYSLEPPHKKLRDEGNMSL